MKLRVSSMIWQAGGGGGGGYLVTIATLWWMLLECWQLANQFSIYVLVT